MGVAVIDEGRFGRGAKVNAGGRQPMTALRTQRYFNQPSRAEEYSTFSRLRATFLDAIPLPNMGTWRCYAKGTIAKRRRLHMDYMLIAPPD